GVLLCQGALSRTEEEHASPPRDLCAGQSVHNAPPSLALPRRVMCPQPGRQTGRTPNTAPSWPQLSRTVAGEQIAIPPRPRSSPLIQTFPTFRAIVRLHEDVMHRRRFIASFGKIFTEQLSGAVTDRPALHDALEFARERYRFSQPDRSPR